MKKTTLNISALLLALAFASGCATTASLNEVRAIAEAAAADASAAAAAAESARAAADRASRAASSAQMTADRALTAASEAQACCDANREAMERMFEKSMAK